MVFGCNENSTFGLTPTQTEANDKCITLDNCKRETFQFEHMGAELKFHFL